MSSATKPGGGTRHEQLLAALKRLPTDYADHGGGVVRWQGEREGWGDMDCSAGCRWARKLAGKLGRDWVVCVNPNSPRAGLLTFEHQAGRGCYEPKR